MKVAIDFDNTFYTPNRDVDDALAFLYLLTFDTVDVVSITSVFGNGSIAEVDQDTRQLLNELPHKDIPYAKGGSKCGDYLTPASHLLVEMAQRYEGELWVLATGAMTNLQGAYLLDPTFFTKLKGIVIMGGITEPLKFPKREMLELNLSCDPQASYTVLSQGHNVSIMTGNHCLDLLFTREDYDASFDRQGGPLTELIKQYSDPWFVDNYEEYGLHGFYNWDSLAAAYLVRPELFEDEFHEYTLTIQALATGLLKGTNFDPSSYVTSKPICKVTLNTPRVKEGALIKKDLFDRWKSLDQLLNNN